MKKLRPKIFLHFPCSLQALILLVGSLVVFQSAYAEDDEASCLPSISSSIRASKAVSLPSYEGLTAEEMIKAAEKNIADRDPNIDAELQKLMSPEPANFVELSKKHRFLNGILDVVSKSSTSEEQLKVIRGDTFALTLRTGRPNTITPELLNDSIELHSGYYSQSLYENYIRVIQGMQQRILNHPNFKENPLALAKQVQEEALAINQSWISRNVFKHFKGRDDQLFELLSGDEKKVMDFVNNHPSYMDVKESLLALQAQFKQRFAHKKAVGEQLDFFNDGSEDLKFKEFLSNMQDLYGYRLPDEIFKIKTPTEAIIIMGRELKTIQQEVDAIALRRLELLDVYEPKVAALDRSIRDEVKDGLMLGSEWKKFMEELESLRIAAKSVTGDGNIGIFQRKLKLFNKKYNNPRFTKYIKFSDDETNIEAVTRKIYEVKGMLQEYSVYWFGKTHDEDFYLPLKKLLGDVIEKFQDENGDLDQGQEVGRAFVTFWNKTFSEEGVFSSRYKGRRTAITSKTKVSEVLGGLESAIVEIKAAKVKYEIQPVRNITSELTASGISIRPISLNEFRIASNSSTNAILRYKVRKLYRKIIFGTITKLRGLRTPMKLLLEAYTKSFFFLNTKAFKKTANYLIDFPDMSEVIGVVRDMLNTALTLEQKADLFFTKSTDNVLGNVLLKYMAEYKETREILTEIYAIQDRKLAKQIKEFKIKSSAALKDGSTVHGLIDPSKSPEMRILKDVKKALEGSGRLGVRPRYLSALSFEPSLTQIFDMAIEAFVVASGTAFLGTVGVIGLHPGAREAFLVAIGAKEKSELLGLDGEASGEKAKAALEELINVEIPDVEIKNDTSPSEMSEAEVVELFEGGSETEKQAFMDEFLKQQAELTRDILKQELANQAPAAEEIAKPKPDAATELPLFEGFDQRRQDVTGGYVGELGAAAE